MRMPPTAPAMPPIPVTEATAFLGNMSETVVKMLADHAWCAAHAMAIVATASHVLMAPRREAKSTVSGNNAKMNIASLRALLASMPPLMNFLGNQPPKTEPTVETE